MVTPAIPDTPVLSVLSPDSIRTTWNAPADMGSPITGYQVRRFRGTLFATFSVSDTSKTFVGLSGDTEYGFEVRAQNANGYSGWSTRESITTDEADTDAMATDSVAIDAEIARLTTKREGIRQSIKDMTELNVTGATFEGRQINHLPLSQLQENEYECTIQINEFIMRKQRRSFIFGQTVRIVRVIPGAEEV